MTRRIVAIPAMLLCLTLDLAAQTDRTASTYHVFPRVADGFLSDGSYFQTHLLVTNVTTQTTRCAYNLYGLSTTRLQGANQFVLLNAGAYQLLPTTGNQQPLASGYGTVSCDGPVTAILFYSYITRFGLAAFATVFSSQSGSLDALFMDQRTGSRLGLAIANDTTSPASYVVIVSDTSGNEVGRNTVTINPKTSDAGFVDQLVNVPPGFAGEVVINSPSGTPFNTIGLLFNGNNFTTVPATVFAP